MISLLKDKEGMTLIEMILAIALLGIITIGVLNVFSFSYATIHKSGYTTQSMAHLQAIAEDLLGEANDNDFDSQTDLQNYLISKSYKSTSESNLTVFSGNSINFFVGPRTQVSGTSAFGYTVTLVKFMNQNKQNVKLQCFVIEGGI